MTYWPGGRLAISFTCFKTNKIKFLCVKCQWDNSWGFHVRWFDCFKNLIVTSNINC